MYEELWTLSGEASDPWFMRLRLVEEEVQGVKSEMCLKGLEMNIDPDILPAHKYVGSAVGCTPSVKCEKVPGRPESCTGFCVLGPSSLAIA